MTVCDTNDRTVAHCIDTLKYTGSVAMAQGKYLWHRAVSVDGAVSMFHQPSLRESNIPTINIGSIGLDGVEIA